MCSDCGIGFEMLFGYEDGSVVIVVVIYETDSKKIVTLTLVHCARFIFATGFHRPAAGATSQRSTGGTADTHRRQALRFRQLHAENADATIEGTILLLPCTRCASAEDMPTNLKNQITQLNNEHECALLLPVTAGPWLQTDDELLCRVQSLHLGPRVRFSD